MSRNHLFTARIWQHSAVRQLRHAFSIARLARRITADQRRLPDYIIVGAQKAGTTSLWSYLNEHPQVVPALTKEMHFFDHQYQRGELWYRMHFPLRSDAPGQPPAAEATLTGESSAYYMFHPLAPHRVAQLLPRVKLVFLLRNPVDRAFSHYQLKLRRRQESLSFEDAIAAESERLNGEEQKLIDEPTYQSLNHDRFSYLSRGRYLEQLQRWQALFPSTQILILESELFFRQTAEVYDQVLNFLGLRPWRPAQFGNRFPGKYRDRMADATRRRLIDYFAPLNQQLYAHLNRHFNWDR